MISTTARPLTSMLSRPPCKNLVYSAHDAHCQLNSGILDVFTFTSPYAIVSLLEDGVQIPKVYLVDDISLQQSDPTFTPSAIESINGRDSTTYLTRFAAANSVRNIEPNVDWNDLVFSWTAHIQNDYSIFQAKLSSFPATLLPLASRTAPSLDPSRGKPFTIAQATLDRSLREETFTISLLIRVLVQTVLRILRLLPRLRPR